jgi:hypothetical protein
MLYMRLADGTRACLSCHGPDPASNPNNVLRGADNPAAITKALNTVSAMGFLSSRLDETDRADVAAFLGTVAALSGSGAWPRAFPVTLESGTVAVGQDASMQTLRLLNEATQALPVGAIGTQGHPLEVTGDCPALLAPGSACEVRTTLRPQGAGWQRSAVRIDLPGAPAPLWAGASVLGSAEPTSRLQLEPAGRLELPGSAGTTVRRTLTLSNPGPMPARVEAVFLLGPGAPRFRIESGCAAGTVLQAGTQCAMSIAHDPGGSPAEAFLRVRTDQGHPASLLMRGESSSNAGPEPTAPAAPMGGGSGCSTRDAAQAAPDPVLLLALLGAWGWLVRGPRPVRTERPPRT